MKKKYISPSALLLNAEINTLLVTMSNSTADSTKPVLSKEDYFFDDDED